MTIMATSPAQERATRAHELAPLETLRDGVWAIAIPMQSRFSTLCYLVEDAADAIHIIDPGGDSEFSWDVLMRAISGIRRTLSDVAGIVITHLHTDHLGMAERLRDASGASISMHRAEQGALLAGREVFGAETLTRWGVPQDRFPELLRLQQWRDQAPKFRADRLLDDGDEVIRGRRSRAIWTPGHTPGHICIGFVDEDLLLSGDHVLPHVSTGLGLGGATATNPIDDYLDSLQKLRGTDHEVGPGHGYRFRGLPERIDELESRLRRRAAEVADILDRAPAPLTVWEVAEQVHWSGGFAALHDSSLANALSQVRMHANFVDREERIRHAV